MARKALFNARTAPYHTEDPPRSAWQGCKSAPLAQGDEFKLKLSSVTAQVASCTSEPGLDDPSFPSAKETNGENMSGFISDPHF